MPEIECYGTPCTQEWGIPEEWGETEFHCVSCCRDEIKRLLFICMKSEDRWYDLNNPYSLVEDFDDDKAIFRILSFDSLLQMFNERSNYLVKTSFWEDVYENFVLKDRFLCNRKEFDMNRLADMLYGQCWTTRMTSDAMWRIYSLDRKSVRIKTRTGKLRSMIRPDDGSVVIGQVKYYSQAKIDGDLSKLPVLTKGELVSLIIQSLFVKRNSFSHESEYRIVYVANSQSENTEEPAKPFLISPFDFIENIYFDPRADDAYVERCTNILTRAFKYPKSRIKKSSLYSFKPRSISFMNKYGNSNWDRAIQECMKEL